MGTLGERLRRARDAGLVGRRRERELFAGLLGGGEPAIVWLHAPGGTGKSSVVRQWAALAHSRGLPVALVDLQLTEAAPARIREALARSLDVEEGELADRLLDGRRYVLLFDTWELGGTCDGWVREALLPSLPDDTLLVFASREPPGEAWSTDAGLRALLRTVPLQNLEDDEAHELLSARQVAAERRTELVALTRGHPLALTLVAEVAQQAPDEPLSLEDNPRVVGQLLDRFARHVPSAAHRHALRACAHARVTTESLLRACIPDAETGALFDWLRSLPFVVESPDGLRPHALARDVIDAEFRWRDPDAYAAQHMRMSWAVLERMRALPPGERDQGFFDLLYLGRIDPTLQRFIAFEELGSGWHDVPTRDERDALLPVAEALGGPGIVPVVDYWLARRPESFLVLRSALGDPVALSAHLTLDGFSDEDAKADPAVPLMQEWMERHGPLGPGERVVVSRFILVPRTAQFIQLRNNTPQLRWLTTPRLRWAFSFLYAPDSWEPAFRRINFTRAHELEAKLDGRQGVFVHDWRADPPDVWAEREFRLQLAGGDNVAPFEDAPTSMTRDELAKAAKDALRDYTRTDALAHNPLVGARCTRGGGVDALLALLDEAVENLGGHPRDEKLQRALVATYVKPAPTQEAAAERLDLPFSTYRRHLTKGVERVVDFVWRRESRG
jgi:hypothetical protein